MTTSGPDVVFLGPSLTHAQAREIYPAAVLLPPAAVGDVISAAVQYRPHAIALIDGAFMQNLATYHKELIDVMARGIWVIGASSMGALRAAECQEYGMIGVGQVFEGYASGAIEDDDEVALSHMAQEFEFRPVTEAMVNIRATMAAAVVAGVLSEPEADALVAAQKERWFMERRPLESVPDAISLLGFSQQRAGELDAFLRNHWVDVKGADARLALAALQELPSGPMPEDQRPELVPSGVYGVLVERDLTVGNEDQLPITRDQIWRHFALNDRRAPYLVEKAIMRTGAVELMQDAGVELTDDDFTRATASLAKDLGVAPEDLVSSAHKFDMSEARMRAWITEEAFILRLTDWRLHQRLSIGVLESCLQQLTRIGEYENTKRTAGLMQSLAAGSGHYETSLGLKTALKLQSTISQTPLPTEQAELDEFIDYLGLGNRAELYERLATLIAGHRELFDLPPIEFVPAEEELSHELEPQSSRGR